MTIFECLYQKIRQSMYMFTITECKPINFVKFQNYNLAFQNTNIIVQDDNLGPGENLVLVNMAELVI